jgi:hypothetical protein
MTAAGSRTDAGKGSSGASDDATSHIAPATMIPTSGGGTRSSRFLTPRTKGPDTKATGNDGGYPGSVDRNFQATDMNRHLQDRARDLEYGDDAEARTGNNVILHAFSTLS